MTFEQQVWATFFGALFAFIFSIVVFFLTTYLRQKIINHRFKNYLKREFQYDIKLLQEWVDMIDSALPKITINNKAVYEYIKYSDLARYFMDESYKMGLMIDLFDNKEIVGLNKMLSHCSPLGETYINKEILTWRDCKSPDEAAVCQQALLDCLNFQKNKLKDFKEHLEGLLKKIDKKLNF